MFTAHCSRASFGAKRRISTLGNIETLRFAQGDERVAQGDDTGETPVLQIVNALDTLLGSEINAHFKSAPPN